MPPVIEINLTFASKEIEKFCSLEDKAKLQELVSQIILASPSPQQYRTEVLDFTESSIHPQHTRLKAGRFDKASSRAPISMQLEGCAERWIIGVYSSREAQKNPKGFADGIKLATEKILSEEIKKQDEKTHLPVPSADTPTGAADKGDSAKKVAKVQVPRKRTANLLNEEIIVALLEKCLKRGGTGRVVDQSDFLAFVRETGLICNPLMVVTHFVKQLNYLEINPIKYNPQLIVTLSGVAFTAAYRQRKIAEQEEVRKLELQKEALQFPEKVLPLLKKVEGLKELNLKIQDLREREKQQAVRNEKLRAELALGEKNFATLEKEMQQLQRAVLEKITKINPTTLAHLLLLAQQGQQVQPVHSDKSAETEPV